MEGASESDALPGSPLWGGPLPGNARAAVGDAPASGQFDPLRQLDQSRQPGVRLRVAGSDDAPDLAKVFIEAWQQAYPGIVDDAILRALDHRQITPWLAALVVAADTSMLVAEGAEGRLLGFSRYGDDPDDSSRGHLYSLYVSPQASGRGIGRSLLTSAVDKLGGERRAVTLWVFEANRRARGLYSSAGFGPDGSTRVDDRLGAPEIRMVRPVPGP